DSVCAEDIAVNGDFLYLADGPGGLKVIDISDKSNPVIVKEIPTLYAIRVYIQGQFIYLCDCSYGYKVFSIADPSNPIMTWSEDTKYANCMAFFDKYLYLGDYWGGFRVYDLSDPAHPSFVRLKEYYRVRDLAIQSNKLLVSDTAYGLIIYDLDDPANPAWAYSKAGPIRNYRDVEGLGDYVLIARNDSGSRINLFDIQNIRTIGLPIEFFSTRFIEALSVSEDTLMVACGEAGVFGYGLTGIPSLEKLWQADTPGYARMAKWYGNYLYVADMSGVCIYEMIKKSGDAI
ncbi:MAG: hypothetical protein ABIC40_04170, partial [bacterium]